MWLRRTGGCICAYRGGSFPIAEFVRVCVCLCVVTKQPLVSKNGLRERLRVCRGGSRNQLRGLKEGGSARRGAMLCLPADLTSHAFNVSTAHPVGFENGREREREGGAGAPRRTGRMNREGEVCSLVTCGVHFGARRRARARRRCVPRQLRLSIRSSECCGTREEAHRHNGNANRRGGSNVRTCALFSVGSTTQVSTAINHW